MFEATVTRRGGLDMQVCVPVGWEDGQVVTFAESKNPCGTQYGWAIRKEGDLLLADAPERNPCLKREGYIHITLDA